MELNLKKNLFRYGKNESLTFGVILALIFFDILIWNIISMGMISVDYRFADNNNCLSQVGSVLNRDIPTFSHYSIKTGKYCTLFQHEYNKAARNEIVIELSGQIQKTQKDINQLDREIRTNRRSLEGNATAYGLAIQEQKGLDLAYTEKLKQIQEQEKLLEQMKQDLEQQKQVFKALPAVQKLTQYARQNSSSISDRYYFMKRLDLFLSYIFAMLFVLILIPVFALLRHRLIKKEKYIRLLLVNHVILMAVLQGIYITVCFILHILPETLLRHLIRFFQSFHLMALWYYIAIFLLFLLFAGVVYFLQIKGRRRNLYKKLIKGKCWSCGARVLDNDFCFSCGEKQMRICSHCHKKTYIKMPYCRFCGRELPEK